ncbi:interleukin-1 receptor type 2 isoform X4 [Triplophysa rosa]|uniref:interleukin-1 receptor type 2 isoform X4 n=1 Tax=Triplophysa rosa TaxID=992332 RepID=UPI002545C339|nr:interleukin-1 receptor type 2 isoform X4 [Triplophysa rosa]
MTVNRKCVFDFCICIIMLSMTLVLTSALPLKDSCVVVGPEIPDFHVQGEAVIIKFPFLEDAIHYRKLQLDNSSTFHINHTNQRNHRSLKSCCDRVVQNGRGILLLPSHPSDSGIYTYVLSGDTYCLIGNISITIYESEEANITVMPYTAHTGENTRVICPHLKYFKRAENPKWYKDFQSTALTVGEGQYTIERGIILTIRNISVKDEGFYTCRLKVILNNIQYNVSRTWRVSGSRLEIQCKVFIGNQSAEFTDVTWMIGGTSVENSYLGKRVFQKEKRISANHIEVQLVILKLQKEDNGAELKCISQNQAKKQEVVTEIKLEDSESVWLVVAVAFSYFILVVFIFLYHLCQKPQKQQVYILAQQKSTI